MHVLYLGHEEPVRAKQGLMFTVVNMVRRCMLINYVTQCWPNWNSNPRPFSASRTNDKHNEIISTTIPFLIFETFCKSVLQKKHSTVLYHNATWVYRTVTPCLTGALRLRWERLEAKFRKLLLVIGLFVFRGTQCTRLRINIFKQDKL